jgi:hypothetical protein
LRPLSVQSSAAHSPRTSRRSDVGRCAALSIQECPPSRRQSSIRHVGYGLCRARPARLRPHRCGQWRWRRSASSNSTKVLADRTIRNSPRRELLVFFTASSASSRRDETPGQYFRLISERLQNVIDHAPMERRIFAPAIDQKRWPTQRPRLCFCCGCTWAAHPEGLECRQYEASDFGSGDHPNSYRQPGYGRRDHSPSSCERLVPRHAANMHLHLPRQTMRRMLRVL